MSPPGFLAQVFFANVCGLCLIHKNVKSILLLKRGKCKGISGYCKGTKESLGSVETQTSRASRPTEFYSLGFLSCCFFLEELADKSGFIGGEDCVFSRVTFRNGVKGEQ